MEARPSGIMHGTPSADAFDGVERCARRVSEPPSSHPESVVRFGK